MKLSAQQIYANQFRTNNFWKMSGNVFFELVGIMKSFNFQMNFHGSETDYLNIKLFTTNFTAETVDIRKRKKMV